MTIYSFLLQILVKANLWYPHFNRHNFKRHPSIEMTERNRSKNFTERECLELIRGVQKYAHVIECRQPGKYRNYDKMSTWEAIAREFNKHAINVRKI